MVWFILLSLSFIKPLKLVSLLKSSSKMAQEKSNTNKKMLIHLSHIGFNFIYI